MDCLPLKISEELEQYKDHVERGATGIVVLRQVPERKTACRRTARKQMAVHIVYCIEQSTISSVRSRIPVERRSPQ